MPSFSLAEAVKVLEATQQAWTALHLALHQRLRGVALDLEGSGLLRANSGVIDEAATALAEARDDFQAGFWVAVRDIVATTRVVELTTEVIDLTRRFKTCWL